MKRLTLSPVRSSLDRVFKTVLFAALLVSLNALGGPTSPKQAASMVKGWLLLTPTPLKTPLSGRTIGSVEAFHDQNGEAIYYAVPLQPEGFIITSADTEIEPVIAFSATGSFEANPDFPLFALLERDLPERLGAVRQQKQPKDANPTASSLKWTRLMQQGTGPQPMDTGLDVIDDLRVAPFIQSRWNQSEIWDGSGDVACYNYYTPPYAAGTTSNYVCGCNNTAWAQIMRYFQYPTQPIGTNSFSIQVDGAATTRALRGGDGLGGPYNWSQMPLVPGVGTTEQERQAIGALTADIAAASHTSYYSAGSGAFLGDSELKSVFRFANAIWDSGLSSQFAAEVNANLNGKLPVYLTIWPSGGHAVVCDGYGYNLSTPYHHLNLGWGGSSDAWYNLPNVTAGYNTVGDFCYNIFTNGTGEIISGRVLNSAGIPIAYATVSAMRTGGGTYAASADANGIYALTGLPSASQYALTVSKTSYATLTGNYATGTSSDYSTSSGNVWGADFIMTYLQITPGSGFNATGWIGGPFSQTSEVFTLTNYGATPLQWTMVNTSLWLNVAPSGGSLAAGVGMTNVTVSLNSTAAALPPGNYVATICFTNLNDGTSQSRLFSLLVTPDQSVLQIRPGSGFYANGPIGGPFSQTPQIFILTNYAAKPLQWTMVNTSLWLTAAPNEGFLAAGVGTTNVTVNLNSTADALPAGFYMATIWFTNLNNGTSQNRAFSLLVGYGQSVVQNGGFETGGFTDWIGSGNWNFVVYGSEYVQYDWLDAHSGNYYARVAPSGALGYISQTLPTVIGQTYLLSLWFNNTNGGTPNEFLVSWAGNTLFDQTNIAKCAWTNLRFKVTATDVYSLLTIGFRNDAYTYMSLDDISAIPVSADDQGPSLTITSPASGIIVTNASLSITGVASDKGLGGHGIYSVTVNGMVATGGNALDNAVANWNAAMNLNVGQNVLTVIASDLLNNSTTQQLTLNYRIPDTQPPMLNIISPISGQMLSNVAVQVTGTASDNVQVSNVWCQLNGSSWNEATTASNWSNWTATVYAVAGTNTIQAYAVDSSGNISATNGVSFVAVLSTVLTVSTNGLGSLNPSYNNAVLQIGKSYSITALAGLGFVFTNWTGGITLPLAVLTNGTTLQFVMQSNLVLQANFVDVQRPTNSITSPTPGQLWSNGVFTVTGKASDNVAVSNVFYSLNHAASTNATTANNWSNWTATALLISGTNTIQAYALDTSGNFSATNSVSFNAILSTVLTVSTNGLGSLNPNFNNALLQVGKRYSITATAGTGFVFTSWTGGITLPLEMLTNGATLQFVMQSNLMLQANFVDTRKPTLSITNLASGQRWSNMVFTAKGTASDNWQVASVQYRLNGGIWTNATGTTNWSTPLTLTPGTNTFAAYATDTTGNNSTTNNVSFQYVVTSLLEVQATGLGTISPSYSNSWLEIGRDYSMTATPGSGFVVTNWTISTNWLRGRITNNATVQFRMAPNLTLQVNFADVTKPTLTVTAPTAGQKMTNAVAKLVGTASDNWKVAGVWYQLNGNAWDLATTTNNYANWTETVTLLVGTNTLKFCALDLGGNFSATNSFSIVSSNTFMLQLAFTDTHPMKTNGLVFSLQLSKGLNGQIQVSTNLMNWTTLTHFVGTNTTITIRDPAATNSPRRFYRAVIP